MAESSAFAALDSMIETVRGLPELVPQAMPEVAKAVGDSVRADLAAGRDPGTGEEWALTKDGGRAMKGAAGALQVTVQGTKVVLQVGEPYVFHHYGARGETPRHVVPDRTGLKLGQAIRIGLVKKWEQRMKGGK